MVFCMLYGCTLLENVWFEMGWSNCWVVGVLIGVGGDDVSAEVLVVSVVVESTLVTIVRVYCVARCGLCGMGSSSIWSLILLTEFYDACDMKFINFVMQ